MFSKLRSLAKKIVYTLSKQKKHQYNQQVNVEQLVKNFSGRNEQYQYLHHYFWNLSPDWLREHRKYFTKERRGFGEDAFHAMWYFIFKEFRPAKVLEIGVYRGQTISLFTLLSKHFNITSSNIHGISPFTPAGDEVSVYAASINYYDDVLLNFKYFNLPDANLHKGFSTDDAMKEIISNIQWDLIYIDGNHDYEVAKQDFELSAHHLKKGGLIILDDASFNTDFKPPVYATSGHAGPSKVAAEIDAAQFEEILSVGHNRVFKKR